MVRSETGFTLLELLVAVAITGILASVGILGFSNYKDKSYVANQQALLTSVRKDIEIYLAGESHDPTAIARRQTLNGNPNNRWDYEQVLPTARANDKTRIEARFFVCGNGNTRYWTYASHRSSTRRSYYRINCTGIPLSWELPKAVGAW